MNLASDKAVETAQDEQAVDPVKHTDEGNDVETKDVAVAQSAEKKKDPFDEFAEPPLALEEGSFPLKDPQWPLVKAAMKEIYDPEIPVNIYELGLIYKVMFLDEKDGLRDVAVTMTLTSPGCPVAQEMPEWIRDAIVPLDGVGQVDVEVVWDPVWDPSYMAETARMELNMYM